MAGSKVRKTENNVAAVTRDPVRTRQTILAAATTEFAREGFSGARIERISKAAATNDRMLYYYFGNKEGLYLAVLEAAYENHVRTEERLKLETENPIDALEMLVAFHWEYYRSHPEFLSVVNSENLGQARYLNRSSQLTKYSSPMLDIIQRVIALGIRAGKFRGDVTAEHLFLTICSVTWFYLSNRHTLSVYLNRDLGRPATMDAWLSHAKRVVVNSILGEASQPR
jgi:AcrR family transcriptional regulator